MPELLLHPLKQALRALRRSPGATLVSLAILAFGVGAATALFSLYSALVLKPLPVAGADRMASLTAEFGGGRPFGRGVGLAEAQELRQGGGPVEAVLLEKTQFVRVETANQVLSVPALVTHATYFQDLRLPLVGGVGYGEGQSAVVLAPTLARQLFGTTTGLGGRHLQIQGLSVPIGGVAPLGFQGLDPRREVSLWLSPEALRQLDPRAARALEGRGMSGLETTVRWAPGATQAQAQAALQARMATWQVQSWKGAVPRMQSLAERRAGAWKRYIPQSKLLWGGLGFLLALSCLNVAQLQAARSQALRTEEATRSALGAGPAQLLTQALAELLVLVAGGALLSLPVAWALARSLAVLAPAQMEGFHLQVGLDLRVLGFALGLLALMGVGLAGMTAWRLFRHPVAEGLRAARGSGRMQHAHRAFLGVQVALALTLLWASASVLGGLRRTLAKPLGLRTAGVSTVAFHVPAGLPQVERAARIEQLRQRVQALPGVTAASLCGTSPLDPLGLMLQMEGQDGQRVTFEASLIGPDYFRTLGIPVLKGREFSPEDGQEGRQSVILSRSQASRLFPGQEALGRSVMADGTGQVVGIVEDHVQANLEIGPRGFVPFRQVGFNMQCLVVRTDLKHAALRPLVERALADTDPRWPMQRLESLDDKLLRQQQPQRLAARMLGGLGLLASLLAFSGIFGLQSHLTSQRRREAGLRMALGSTPLRVALDFASTVVWPALMGLVCGGLLILGSRPALLRLLGDLGTVTGRDLGFAAAGLLATAFLAAWVPALRAAQVDPSQALKGE